MNKVISVAAILALSAASNEFADLELANFHLDQPRPHRPTFSPLVAHDDEFMSRREPEIYRPHYRTFTPLVADDNDDEFVYAGAALRADDDEFYVEQADNELGFFKSIGNGLKKAGQFVVQNPKIITTAAKFLDDNDDEFVYAGAALRADDNDDEFFVDEQDDEFLIRLNPELTRPTHRIPPNMMMADDNDDEFVYAGAALRADDNDDEFFADEQDDEFLIRLNPELTRPTHRIPPNMMIADDNDDEFYVEQADNELGFFKSIGNGLKKAGQFVVQHPQIITTAAKFLDDNDDEFFAQDAAFMKKAQRNFRLSNEALINARAEKKADAQDNFASLRALLKEGKTIQPARKPQPKKIAEVQDNNLSIKDKLKGAANWIGDHPQVITEAAKTYKALKGKK